MLTNLSNTEKKAFDQASRRANPTAYLGTRIQDIITMLNGITEAGTPVNAVNAFETLSFTGVVIHGETVTINNPINNGIDIYEFLTDDEQVPSDPDNIPVDISANASKAVVTLTMDVQPISGDTITLGTKVYTFVPVGTDTSDGEVSVGTDLAAAKLALVAAINGTDGISDPHPLVKAAAFASDDCVISAIKGGTIGNGIASTQTLTAVTNIFSAATLTTGSNCSAANAVTALIAEITASDSQDIIAEAVQGQSGKIKLSASVAGEVGNDIEVSEACANGSFPAEVTTLSGGVNGTVASSMKFMIDSTYLYICPVANTVSGKTWRRIALGEAF